MAKKFPDHAKPVGGWRVSSPVHPTPFHMKNRFPILLLCLGTGLGTLTMLRADDAPPPPSAPPPGAPGGPGGGGHGEHRQERMIKELGLSGDQLTKWQAIGQQERDAVKAVREDASVAKDAKWAKIGEIRKGFDAQRRALLTPDQLPKFDEMLAKRQDRMRNHHDGQGPDGPPPPPPPPATDGK
jgi:Spy/CpxP family protein refolding chaperone